MSRDTVDLIKVVLVVFALAAVAIVVVLYLGFLLRTYGAGLPVISDLPRYEPPAAIPVVVDTRLLILVGAVFLTASGLALIVASETLDMALAVLAKAVTVVIAAGFGIFAGTWAYMRLSAGTDLSLLSLNRLAIGLLLFFLFATVLSNRAMRQWGPMRFVAAAVLIALGPFVQAMA